MTLNEEDEIINEETRKSISKIFSSGDLTWLLLLLLMLVFFYKGITDCNNFYLDKMLNNTFLEEMMDYNNEQMSIDPGFSMNLGEFNPNKPKTLNISIT